MKYVEAPQQYEGNERSLFLAGGITGCRDWNSELIKMLEKEEIVIFNPRRKYFPMDDPNAAEEQIRWEFPYLRKATAIAFWFPPETLCPIALYELGAWSMTDKLLFIGVHPEYQRRLDVEIQTQLVRPEIKIAYSLEDLARQILDWIRQ